MALTQVSTGGIKNGTIVDADIHPSAAIADTKLATISTAGKVSNSATIATDANTASAIVARDASGNFSAGTITASLTGTASNASAVPWSGVSGKPTTLSGFGITDAASSTHSHGNITNGGAIGATSGIPIITGTSGILQAGSFGTTSGTFCQGSDSRLSDQRVPTDGSVTNAKVSASAGIVDTKLATISTANKVSLSALNLDGATDIGAGLADADLIIVDDGGNGTNRKSAVSRIPEYTFSKVSSDITINSSGAATIKTNVNLAGNPTTTTQSAGTNNTTIATTAFVSSAVDAARQGLTVKQACRVATTANITLSGTQTIDGVTLSVGDRALVKNQATASQNGIYLCSASAWTRTTDFNESSDLLDSAFTFVEEGAINADSGWVLTTDGSITVGITSLAFQQFSGAGQIIAGSGLTKTGSQLDVGTASASRIVVNNDNIDLATTGVSSGTYKSVTVDSYGRITAGTNPTTLSGYGITDAATSTHTHGNITNAGAIGTTSGVPIITGTSGILQAGSFGTTSGTFCQGNDSRLSNQRVPTDGSVTNAKVASNAAIVDTKLAQITTAGKVSNSATTATSANTASAIVARDASGNFSAGTITAALNGNASTATILQTARTINGVSFNGSSNITVTANSPNTLTRGTYLTGSNFNGSAATTWAVDATSANTASKVVARDASGNFSAGTIAAALSGNATTATSLQTARTINGTSFNGSANITTASWGTARNVTIGNTTKSVNGSANVTWTLEEIGASSGGGASYSTIFALS